MHATVLELLDLMKHAKCLFQVGVPWINTKNVSFIERFFSGYFYFIDKSFSKFVTDLLKYGYEIKTDMTRFTPKKRCTPKNAVRQNL